MLRLLGAGAELGLQVYMSPIPVVLGVTGHALAMGGILTTCADHRVGADGPFKIGLNEVAIGMPVPGFAIGMCRDRLRKTWFQRCLQLAYICSPAEAVEAGFLDEVVAPDAVADRALEVATGLAAYVHPGPFRATRTGMRGETAEQLRAGLARDLGAFDVTPA
jgi:enoyl-CoA hydratase